ncbi:MAG: TonB-dependent receptor [Cytophagaceae bacterium]|jgi:iron complex outermembrane receptor protein|nr:TonB-dependent receptor [Cytophagaceae bacterium]
MLSTVLLLLNVLLASIQCNVKDAQSGENLSDVQIKVSPGGEIYYSDANGNFYLSNKPGTYSFTLFKEGYKPNTQNVEISDTTRSLFFTIQMKETISQEIVVKAVRAPREVPVSQQNISREEITKRYFGHDVPTFLNSATSVNSYSETGNGIGYSYFRMRGIDQTRINYTVNGIPVNDPETQGYYFNNFADLLSSVQSIQIQRGVGTSSNGTASFAGSVNMLGINLADTGSFGFSSGYGSFQSKRLSAEWQSGRVSDRFAFYGRVSNISTEGYRDRSGVAVNSYYISGAYFGKKSLFKFTSFGGEANSQLAYVGTAKSILDTNRRYNPLTRFDKDKFRQTFHQLHYAYKFSRKVQLTSAAYWVKGDGHFDVYVPGMPYFALNLPDTLGTSTNSILRYQLNMDLVGAMSYLTYQSKQISVTAGFHANTFTSRHFMTTPWLQVMPDTFSSDHIVHDNTGYKNEMSAFGKFTYQVSPKFLVYADAQWRTASFQYRAVDKPIYRDSFSMKDPMQWTFLNPKAGFRFSLSPNASVYSSIGRTTREPTRVDLIVDDRALEPIRKDRVKPEEVVDIEVGTDIQSRNFRCQANVYVMEFKNEIIATGKLNSVGYAMRENVAKSFRRGVELEVNWKLHPKWQLLHASSVSHNRIRTLVQNLPVFDTLGNNTFTTETFRIENTQPLMTPTLMLNQGVRYSPLPWLSLEIMGKYVSKVYLDNTSTENLTAPAYFFADARVSADLSPLLKRGQYTLSLQWNNFTNTDFYPNGTANHFYQMQSGGSLVRTNSPAYYPAAPSNFFVTLNMKF